MEDLKHEFRIQAFSSISVNQNMQTHWRRSNNIIKRVACKILTERWNEMGIAAYPKGDQTGAPRIWSQALNGIIFCGIWPADHKKASKLEWPTRRRPDQAMAWRGNTLVQEITTKDPLEQSTLHPLWWVFQVSRSAQHSWWISQCHHACK